LIHAGKLTTCPFLFFILKGNYHKKSINHFQQLEDL
jgi:hypothetical protein